MAQYYVNPDKFIKLKETSGYLYVSQGSGIEVCTDDNPVAGTGIVVLKSDNSAFKIAADKIYVRALREKNVINVVAVKAEGGGGGGGDEEFVTDEEVEEMLDDVFDGDDAYATDGDVDDMLDDVFGDG
jgi:hypothetical protein